MSRTFRVPANPIETARLILETLTVEHLDDLVALDSDPEVMRYLTGGRPSSPAEVAAVITDTAGTRWRACTQKTGEFVGWFGLETRHGGPHEHELGYRLLRKFWGQGLATEGGRALVDCAFRDLHSERVWAQTMALNSGSRRVMEKCGLVYARTLHLQWGDPIGGTEHGEVEYQLLREAWSPASAVDGGG